MIIERLYDGKLAQASYLIACGEAGEAIVIDANRDVDQYIRLAEAEGLRIAAVTETHIHADFVSGSRELAARTGAQLHLSDEGDADWKYGFARDAGASLIRAGDTIRIGNVRLDVVHTPGHTPEHVVFLVTDGAAADRPIGVVTGDFVFVGDVGRPDLLETAAGVVGAMEAGARRLFRSLRRFRELPDYLQIWPGHGAGSACGKGLSSIPTSTVGYERLFNWAFQVETEDDFVPAILSGQPEPPRYFAEMKRVNRDGPAILGGFSRPERRDAQRLEEVLAKGGLVVDARPAESFAEGHVPGTINIPLTRSFTTWAGWLIPYDRDFHLLLDEECGECVNEAVRDLAMIGLDRVAGYFGSEVIDGWESGGREVQTVAQIGTAGVERLLREEEGVVVDVRGRVEREKGRIPDALHLPLFDLEHRAGELPRDRPIAVHCARGGRSPIAASILQAKGFIRVLDYRDGYEGWAAAGKPVVEEDPSGTS